MNSRPLCSSDEPGEEALTPAHFLFGTPYRAIGVFDPSFNTLPEPDQSRLDITGPRKLRALLRMASNFWHRWKGQYLHTLQTRPKWAERVPNLEPGRQVFLVEGSTPVIGWPLATVEKTHPGPDGLVRTVDIRLDGKTLTRAVNQLAPLEFQV